MFRCRVEEVVVSRCASGFLTGRAGDGTTGGALSQEVLVRRPGSGDHKPGRLRSHERGGG